MFGKGIKEVSKITELLKLLHLFNNMLILKPDG